MKEGSFEGLAEGLDFAENWTVSSSIARNGRKPALPTEVPERIDLSQVPANILRSNVVETLVSQNEDLMSRLTVALRRNAALEEKISDARLETEQIRAKYENLNDQLLVLKEKSRALAERKDREENEYQALRDQIRLLEIRYAELYNASTAKEANLLSQFEGQSKALARLERYRARVQRAAAGLKKTAKEKWQAEVKLAQSEIAQENLRKHLAESADYIANLTKEHKQALAALQEENEKRIAQMREQLVEASERNERLAERVTHYDQMVETVARLENEIVLRERREEELRIQTTAEISDLQKTLVRYRNEAKDLALKLEEATAELTEKTTALEEARGTQKALEEQVENLQILWRDHQSQIEKLNEKNRSLQKLNQELSVAINQYRREIRELKERADQQALEIIENQKLAATAAAAAATAPKNAENPAKPELLQKIDEVFVEIHTNKL